MVQIRQRPIAFATSLHAALDATSKPAAQISFVGQSYPYYAQVRAELARVLAGYPTLPVERADLADFARVHASSYLDALVTMATGGEPASSPRLSIECSGMEYCLPGYQYGLGGMVAAIDQMRRGLLDRAYCYCLGGHHAHADWGHGYCLLNPQAAAVRYAQEQGFARVLIVDWDIHHGDGTQAIFANDPSVYCISVHSAADLYMAKASSLAVGTTTAAARVGHCNIPLLHQALDTAHLAAIGLEGQVYRGEESVPALRAALAQLPWRPDLVCIFAGYDGHRDDCGRRITDWTNDDFATLTAAVCAITDHAGCPLLSVHGGGYKLPITIAAAERHVAVLAGQH